MPTRQIKENSCACYGSSDIHDCYCNTTKQMKECIENKYKAKNHRFPEFVYNRLKKLKELSKQD